ncbi:hypothetical protein ABTZ99_24170 [Actinosynnema sp. NPDC002837]
MSVGRGPVARVAVVLGDHTTAQVTVGTALGAIVGGTVFWLLTAV